MINVDGSQGEGGGQVLRTALTLSLITHQAVRVHRIRANRKPAGLRPQHLKSVEAAAVICGGKLSGATLESCVVDFQPGTVKPGNYHFDIGTAGSTTLLLQTILLPLCRSGGRSKITIKGGTHVPWSPCYHYLAWHWLPFLKEMGMNVEVDLCLAGYYPRGEGEIKAKLIPTSDVFPIRMVFQGNVKTISGISAVSNLSRKIAERQRNQVVKRLGSRYPLNDIRIGKLPSKHKGTLLLLLVECEQSKACFFGLGALGKPAEKVADEAIDGVLDHLNTSGAVDPYLADQLLLPMALSKEPSRLSTSQITKHLLTQAKIIEQFLAVNITIDGKNGLPGIIEIEPKTSN